MIHDPWIDPLHISLKLLCFPIFTFTCLAILFIEMSLVVTFAGNMGFGMVDWDRIGWRGIQEKAGGSLKPCYTHHSRHFFP
jgi:hypothetical protein